MRFSSLFALSALTLLGCGGAAAQSTAGARLPAEGLAPPSPAVSDDAFAESMRVLLRSEPGSAERANRLSGVEARQMERAVGRFKRHDSPRGLTSVLGGLELLRAGELRDGTLGPLASDALKGAARELSARGDEGRAEAAFHIWALVAPTADRAEIQTHLDAISQWMKGAVAKGSPLVSAGALENVAVSRRVLEPSQEALDLATSRTVAWIDKAFELRQAWAQNLHGVRREEEIEEARVEAMGGPVLASIYLRDADAKGALAAIQKAQAQDLVRDDLTGALKAVVSKATASNWLDVIHALAPQRREEPEDVQDEEIVRAAVFAMAAEAYRLDPTEIEPAVRVAAALGDFGMAEASPLVLIDAVRAHPDPRVVKGALQITMRSMQQAVDADEPDAARRTFRAAKGLLDLAAPFAGKLEPSAARVRSFMGEIEVREGRLDEARALFEEALKEERSGSVLLQLARIDRHDKHTDAALAHLRDALTEKDAVADPALRGEILLETSDLAREQGDARAARTPLTGALTDLTKARGAATPDDRARVERVLSRVLDRFGAAQPAQRALDRAFDAAPHDKHQAAATVGLIVARAFVRGDLSAARDGLQRGLAADLDDEDLVYYALWVRLLERQLKAPTDGAADRILSRASEDAGWIGRIARFGAGLAKADDLAANAKTPAEKTEATFYAAMDRRASGDAKGADTGLREVVGASGIDLMEVAIARDLIAGPHATVQGPIPPEAALP